MSSNMKRIISAMIMIPIIVIILLLNNKYILDVVLSIIAILAIHEYFNAVSKESKPVRWIGYVCCLSIAVIHIIPMQYISTIIMMSIPIILLILFLAVIVTEMKINFRDIAYTFLGIAYIAIGVMSIALVYGMENGQILIWYLLGAAWVTDTFAYSIGRRIGKHKFSKISPKKSIEGCIAGTIGAILVMCLYTYIVNRFWNMNISYISTVIIALVLSLIGQIGDLAESSIKRYVDIKDSSNLIPGHGGALDRIDSLLFIAPFAYALFMILL